MWLCDHQIGYGISFFFYLCWLNGCVAFIWRPYDLVDVYLYGLVLVLSLFHLSVWWSGCSLILPFVMWPAKNYGGVTVVNCSISSRSQWAEASHFCVSFPDIFQEAGLPLWLQPYEVLVTSSYTALIETIPDTVFCLAAKAFCLLKYYVYNLMSYSSLGFYSCNQE